MAGHSDTELVSVVIANYNGIDFIEPCLGSVLASNYPDLEVILVDNASSDGSLELVQKKFVSESRLRIIVNQTSLGPVKARNIGIANACGAYIAFLDNDTEVESEWLNALVGVLQLDTSIGAAQSKILLSDRSTFDTCGHFLSISGFPYEIGVGERDLGQYDQVSDIFGARSAAMFVRRDVLDKSGFFDADYFMHGEETDLSWRIRLQGYRIVYVPQSVVYHKKGGSLTLKSRRVIFFEGSKNCTKTLIKNLGLARLSIILPIHVLGWFVLSVILFLKFRFGDAGAIWQGLFWDAAHIRHILEERSNIQGNRRVSDRELALVMMGKQGFGALFKKGLAWIGRT